MTSTSLRLEPIPLPPNYVWRSYAGGRVLRSFRGTEGTEDDHVPEDWLASTVRARNGKNSQGPDEGLSRLGDPTHGQRFTDSIQQDPGFWFGKHKPPAAGTGVLWKLLDSSVRLQFQAHPDVAYARKHLNSNAGKTECWHIIETREQACVYLGFQRPPSRKDWARMIQEQRVDEMLSCFDRIPVKAGDCFVIPAGTPHAIGAGVFMMELMEPTDWVVRCEIETAGVRLTPDQCFMGLDLERCLDVFDYGAFSLPQVRGHFRQSPQVVTSGPGFVEEELIAKAHHGFFRLHRLRGDGPARWSGGELLMIIALKGHGVLSCDRGEPCGLQAGQTWLLPGAAGAWEWTPAGPGWELLLAKLPIPRGPS